MNIKKIDHISIAVKNLEKARGVYERILGLELASTYVSPGEKIKVARYRVGDVWLELMEPTAEGEISKFLKKRGEGIFLISYEVPDIEQAMAELKGKGHKLIDNRPRHLLDTRYAFINHPTELCGVLTEVLDYQAENE